MTWTDLHAWCAWAVAAAYAFVTQNAVNLTVFIPFGSAFFGAYTAQRIAELNRTREDLTKEIRSTNAALSVAFSVCNSAIALKRQHVTQMKEEFRKSKADFEEHLRKRATGEIQGDKVYRFPVHLMTLNPPKLASDSLRSMVLDRLTAVGRPLHLAVEIVESTQTLTTCLDTRNKVIEDMKKNNSEGLSNDGSAQRFFGLKFGGGHQDLTFPHLVDNIARSTDDVIFFAYLLCEDLRKHGDKLVEKYHKRFGSVDAPHISEIDFSPRVADGTVPPRDQYKDWTTNFVERVPAPPTLWQRIRHPYASQKAMKAANAKRT